MTMPDEKTVFKFGAVDSLEKLNLKPEEAFVLSRIDGQSSLKAIAQMVSYDVAKVWTLIERAVQAGAIVPASVSPTNVRPVAKDSRSKSILDQLEEEDRDPVLSKIARDKRNDILLRHQKLKGQTHYDVLGVGPKASPQEIEAKYFQLVKSLHPDRFFGKELGHYRQKLDDLFQRVTEAHNVLADSPRRKAYDRTLAPAEGEKPKTPEQAASKGASRVGAKNLVERIAQAKKYFEMGKAEESMGDGVKAANFYQMALQYEPNSEEYMKAFERVVPFLRRKRAEDMFDKGMQALELSQVHEAIEHMEEALKLNPRKRECYRELPLLYLAIKKGNLERALTLAKEAIQMYKRDAFVFATLGRVLSRLNDFEEARKAFKEALKIDPQLEEAEEGLRELKGK